MIGVTHISIATACGLVAGVPEIGIPLLAAGSLLPDIDSPKSTIGRVFFFVSIPMGKAFGHRGATHSFWLWGLIMVIGIFWHPLLYIGAGGLSHVLADCYTVSGVRAMAPFSSKVFVIFRRDWRIKTGSNTELVILLVCGIFAWSAHKVTSYGGIGAMIGHITGSPKIMFEEYVGKGLEICDVEGKFRWANGKVESVKWQIIGIEKSSGLAFVDGQSIVRTPLNGRFLRARLKPTGDAYESLRVKGWMVTSSECWFLSKGKWFHAKAGDLVYGNVIGKGLKITFGDDELYSLKVEKH